MTFNKLICIYIYVYLYIYISVYIYAINRTLAKFPIANFHAFYKL